MKKTVNIISRAALAVAAAGALSLSSSVFAQNETPATGNTASPQPTDTPFSSMAPVGQKPRVKKDSAKAAMSPASTSALAGTNDQTFLATAAKGGMMEVHMGQMAQKDGQSDEVKKLGGTIAADHTKANNELMAIAQRKGVKLDTRHSMDKMGMKDKMKFDQEWLTMMVRDHDKDIALYDQEAKMGTDPEVKAFAKKTLPVLKKHLKMVKDAQSKMMKKA